MADPGVRDPDEGAREGDPVDVDVGDVHEDRDEELPALVPDLADPPIGGGDDTLARGPLRVPEERGEESPGRDGGQPEHEERRREGQDPRCAQPADARQEECRDDQRTPRPGREHAATR